MSKGAAAHLVETYTQTLLELAEQSGIVDAVATDLENVSALLSREPSFQAFLSSPYFAERTKRDLVHKVLADNLDRMTLNFLSVVIDHNRGALLPEMIDRYRQLHRARRGYRTVTAVVAKPLRDDQKDRLAGDLAAAMDAKVDLEMRVDPSLIGGVILRFGDRMLDNSVRGRLLRTVTQIANPANRYKR